jgi:hypothetical protein
MVVKWVLKLTGTVHVATARFDVTRRPLKIGFRRILARRRNEIDQAGSKHEEREQK